MYQGRKTRKNRLHQIAVAWLAIVQLAFFPLAAGTPHAYATEDLQADTSSVSQAADTAPETETPAVAGPTEPTGPERSTYTYNEATGLWENEHYTWNPKTKQTKPKAAPAYSYNPDTGQWDTTEWRYDAAAGKYVANTISKPAVPAPQTIATKPASETAPRQTAAAAKDSGPQAQDETAIADSANGYFDLYYNADISQDISVSSNSGNVNLQGNTSVGNGASGNALAVANIINLLQAAWNPNGDIATFNIDIYGDVVGDLYIDPAQLGAAGNEKSAYNGSLSVNAGIDATMENDIAVRAASGDVNASANTEAGNLSSGTARAVANVVNMINSAIAVGDSFIGNINIHGDFEGDILLPEEDIRLLLASNEVPRSTISIPAEGSSTTAAINTTQQIDNAITASANSGTATLGNNTQAGSANSGQASTNVTVLNLTGRAVAGDNALLVFVNVLGSWVGMIVDAPAGTTAAAYGGNGSQAWNTDTDIDITEQLAIQNNIVVDASSGDVSGSGNTTVGDATSGEASAGVNVANISNSSFSLSDWFGLLFINVFGSWRGSFGINTAMGNRTLLPPATPGTAETSRPTSAYTSAPAQVLRFVPRNLDVSALDRPVATTALYGSASEPNDKNAVAGATASQDGSGGSGMAQKGTSVLGTAITIGILSLLAIAVTESAIYLSSRRNLLAGLRSLL